MSFISADFGQHPNAAEGRSQARENAEWGLTKNRQDAARVAPERMDKMTRLEMMNEVEYVALVNEYAEGWEEGLSVEDWANTTIEDIKASVMLDGIYEDLTEEEFETFSAAILRKVHADAEAQS